MTCGATCGITKERANELAAARRLAEEPGGRGAVSYDALRSLGADLESILPVRVHVHVGAEGECDSLYVLVGLERASLAAFADGACSLAETLGERQETYVRLAVSPYGRFVVMQEVVVTSEAADGGVALVWEPQAGVVDRRLQHVVKGLQGALRKAKLVVLDLAAVLEGEPATLWTRLFEETSPLASRATWIMNPRAAWADAS